MNPEDNGSRIGKLVKDRRFIFFGLLIVLVILSLYFASNYQNHLENPNTSIIIKSYPLGETVAVAGVVTDVHDGGFNLQDTYKDIVVNYTIISGEHVSNGDQVEVLGILQPSYTVNATKILVISSFDYSFMLFRSALVALIFLFFFFRYWEFDLNKFEFRRRR
jgi:hypothetical protein